MNKTLTIIMGVVGLGALSLIGIAIWAWLQLQPVDSKSTTTERFVISRGQSVAVTAENLKTAGLIKNALIFRLYARYKKLDTAMQAGSYQLSKGMSTTQLATTLTQGTEDQWITLLEGWRVEEVADYLAAQGLPEFDKEEFLTIAKDSEGMIFPDSYLIPKESTAKQLFTLFTATFDKKVTTGLEKELAAAKEEDFTTIITLASLVEREARSAEDKRRVAGILNNRLKIGMALQVDATLQYIQGYDTSAKTWWAPPSIESKKSTSNYNTYLNPGLPPGPICNPGIQAIKAVLDPIPSDDLFYLHAPSGEMYYAATLEEHNQNVSRYLR